MELLLPGRIARIRHLNAGFSVRKTSDIHSFQLPTWNLSVKGGSLDILFPYSQPYSEPYVEES